MITKNGFLLTHCLATSFIRFQYIAFCTTTEETAFGIGALLRAYARRIALVEVHTFVSIIQYFSDGTSAHWPDWSFFAAVRAKSTVFLATSEITQRSFVGTIWTVGNTITNGCEVYATFGYIRTLPLTIRTPSEIDYFILRFVAYRISFKKIFLILIT